VRAAAGLTSGAIGRRPCGSGGNFGDGKRWQSRGGLAAPYHGRTHGRARSVHLEIRWWSGLRRFGIPNMPTRPTTEAAGRATCGVSDSEVKGLVAVYLSGRFP